MSHRNLTLLLHTDAEPTSSIELSEQPHATSERQHSGQQASATGRQASCDMSKVPNSYGLSAGLSSSAAVAAASRLAGLRAESMQQPAGAASSPSADGQSKVWYMPASPNTHALVIE